MNHKWFLSVFSELTVEIGCPRRPVAPSNREFPLPLRPARLEVWKVGTMISPALRSLRTFDTYPPESLGFMRFRNFLTQPGRFSRPPEQLLSTPRINPARDKKPSSRLPILGATATHWK